MWSIYSNTGIGGCIVLPPVILLFIYWKRLHSFYYVVVISAMLLVMNISKLFYHQPRPYWVRAEIEAYNCSTQFGNPSGHCLFSAGMATTLWLDFFVFG